MSGIGIPAEPAGEPAGLTRSLAALCRRYPLLSFYVLAFGLTWTEEILLIMVLGLPLDLGAFLAPVVGPTGAAVIVTSAIDGRGGLRRLIGQVGRWRVGLRWYLVTLIGIPLAYLLGTLVLPGALDDFTRKSPLLWVGEYVLILIVGGFIGGPVFEEPGWRGFALPRLQRRWGALLGTLVVGTLWAFWHLPLYFVPEWSDQNAGLHPSSLIVFLLTAISVSYIITWIYNHTNESLLLAMLAHSSLNTAQVMVVNRLFPDKQSTEINALIGFGIFALVLIVATRGRLGYQEREVAPAANAAAGGTRPPA